jgi:geranylgeranyl pyrophosphate synthase
MTIPEFIRRHHEETYRHIHQEALKGIDWPDIVDAIVDRQASTANTHAAYGAILPLLTCTANGGEAEQAIPLAAAWILYDLASDVFDDLQDLDGKDRPWNRWSPARTLAVGLGLIAAGEFCLSGLKPTAADQADLLASLARTFMLAARGQGSEQAAPTLASYLNQLIAKSGLIFAAVTRAGASLCSSNPEHLQAMHDYGMALGVSIQLRDDCRDLSSSNAVSDLVTGKHTLPVLYALSLQDHQQHPRLASLLNQPRDGLAACEVEEVCQILADMGAFAYTVAVAKVYEQKALAALQTLPPDKTAYLRTYALGLLNFQPQTVP